MKINPTVLKLILMIEASVLIILLVMILQPIYKVSDLKHVTKELSAPDGKVYQLSQDILYEKLEQQIEKKQAEEPNKDLIISFPENISSNDISINMKDYYTELGVSIDGKNREDYETILNFASDTDSFVVEPEIIIQSYIDEERLCSDIITQAQQYEMEMKKPTFVWNGSSLSISEQGTAGRKLDTEDLKEQIEKATTKLFNNSNSLSNFKISLKYEDIPVYPTLEDVSSIDSTLGTYGTNFARSTDERKNNIEVATNRINGTLLMPSETISINKLILERNAENGYQSTSSDSDDYTGGVGQVSSTLYGAILRSGIIPVERHSHVVAISYCPLGLDAALIDGYKDLQIKNTYDTPIYISGVIFSNNITFTIYGAESAMNGYTYRPYSVVSNSGTHADSWLQKLTDTTVVEEIHLFESDYRVAKEQ